MNISTLSARIDSAKAVRDSAWVTLCVAQNAQMAAYERVTVDDELRPLIDAADAAGTAHAKACDVLEALRGEAGQGRPVKSGRSVYRHHA